MNLREFGFKSMLQLTMDRVTVVSKPATEAFAPEIANPKTCEVLLPSIAKFDSSLQSIGLEYTS